MMRRLFVSLALFAGLSGCASYTALAPKDRDAVAQEFTTRSSEQFLKLSFYVTPFFGDGSKKLLTDVPPAQVRLLNDTKGAPINPGAAEKTIPAGRRVRIQKVEFPTSWVVTERIVYSPRTQPWVYLSIEGEKNELPYILVLRPQIKTTQEFHAELERYLVKDSPAEVLAAFSPAVREAVEKKEAISDMPEDALLRAWGYPESKRVSYEEQARKEVWLYPGRKRSATVVDGRVAEIVDGA